MTCSNTESSENSCGFWNVLITPSEAMTLGRAPATSLSFQNTRPALGGSNPASRLSSVVFPDPFGPKMPMISPFSMPNDTSDTATRPPKRFVRFSTLRSMGPPLQQAGAEPDNSARHHQDHEDQDHAVHRDARFRRQFDQMRQRCQHQRADHGSEYRGDAAEQHHGDGVE